ncbi:MAG: cytidine deaminase [Armatimonadetes bacterium]|nr:cytidine deaminase [Armatimonadota bacterium]
MSKNPSKRKPASDKDFFLEVHRFQTTGLIGLQTAAAAAMAAAGPMVGMMRSAESDMTVYLQRLIGELTCIPKVYVDELTTELEITLEQLMLELVLVARLRARAPISHYRVGAVGLGTSGTLYLGFNLEFPGQSLIQTVHAEQCVVALAMTRGERGFTAVANSEPPSGLTRQFLNELANASDLRYLIPSRPPTTLRDLFPDFFGPEDMGAEGALLESAPHAVELAEKSEDELVVAALEAARRAYCPYTHCPSGVALLTGDDIYTGSYAESAAFNPSLPPLQAALVNLAANGGRFRDIERLVLVERRPRNNTPSQEGVTRIMMDRLAPKAEFEVKHLA